MASVKVFEFAGIGSRETPLDVCAEMVKIGEWARANGAVVRSGHAKRADLSFELGAKENCDVFLPWKGFNAEDPILGNPIVVGPSAELDALVKEYHPAPQNLSRGAWALMRRNGVQVMGLKADRPVKAVVCWRTKSGGTDQAVRIADGNNIPVKNMAEKEWSKAENIIAFLDKLSKGQTL